MKTYLFQTAFWLATLCAMPVKLTAQVKHTVTFQRDSIQVREKQYEDGNPYTTLEYPYYYTDAEEGAPALPYRCLQFIIPDEATGYTVEVAAAQEAEFTITTPLLPGQKPVSLSIYSTKPAFVPPDPALYSSSSRYPAKIAEIVNDGYFDGDKRIVTVRVFPMQYVAAENKIILNKNFTFTICPDRSRTAALHKIAPVHAAAAKSEEELKQELNFVENKQDIPLYAVQANNAGLRILPPYPSLPAYEYTIIAPQAFYSALERLVSWKRMKGMTAGVVTLESIINDPAIKGDEVSGIYDDAGKIRHYLTSAYQRGTKYVFLVGKDIPFRYGTGFDSWQTKITVDLKIPTDLYFSDLNGNWNVDKDEYYGEPSEDEVDYFPELYVGRITCKNLTELNNYLDKLFCYEKNPGYGDNSYLEKALYVQADEGQEEKMANNFAKLMNNNFIDNIYEELPSYDDSLPTSPKGSDIIQELNTHYGLAYFATHGGDVGIKTLTIGKNIGGISGIAYCDAYDEDPYNEIAWHTNETGNGVDCLTNIGYPFVIYTLGCTTMPYDKLNDIPYNFGEAFTIMGKYGAVAYLGSTRPQYIYYVRDNEFAASLNSNQNRLGIAEAKSRIGAKYARPHSNALSHNLLGCPEIQLWTARPSTHPTSSIEISYGTSGNIRVNSNIEHTDFGVVGLFSGNSYHKHVNDKNTALFENLPQNYTLTLKGENHLPYIAPLYLQNENITGSYKIFDMKNVFIGNQVNSYKATGNFIIKNGAQLFIEYSGEMILDSGFEVESGGVFEAIPNNT